MRLNSEESSAAGVRERMAARDFCSGFEISSVGCVKGWGLRRAEW